jgi:hypothetical protein
MHSEREYRRKLERPRPLPWQFGAYLPRTASTVRVIFPVLSMIETSSEFSANSDDTSTLGSGCTYQAVTAAILATPVFFIEVALVAAAAANRA